MALFDKARRFAIKVLQPTEDELDSEVEDLISEEMFITVPEAGDVATLAKLQNNHFAHMAVLQNETAKAINTLNRNFGLRVGRLEAKFGVVMAMILAGVGSLLGFVLEALLK